MFICLRDAFAFVKDAIRNYNSRIIQDTYRRSEQFINIKDSQVKQNKPNCVILPGYQLSD